MTAVPPGFVARPPRCLPDYRQRLLRASCLALLACGLGAAPRAAAAQPTLSLEPLNTIGVLDGEDALVFGFIADVAADRAGNVYVLDQQAMELRVFSPEGRFLGRIGRPGRGPGEFYHPVALALNEQDRLFVLDPGNARIEIFDGEGAARQRAGALPLGFDGTDLCVREGWLYVLGMHRGLTIHELDPSGRHTRSFGDLPGASDPLLAATRSGGKLTCGNTDPALFFLPHLDGHVLAFETAAESDAWQAALPGHNPAVLRRSGPGSITLTAGRGGTHDVAGAVTVLAGGVVLVQTGELARGPSTRQRLASIRSYLALPGSRTAVPLGNDLPRIVAARGDRAYAVQTDPFPAVTIHRFRIHSEERR